MGALLNRIGDWVLDSIFPQTLLVKKLECMSAVDFERRAKKSNLEASFDFPVYALFSYRDPFVRVALHEVKYRKNKKIAHLFAEVINDLILIELEDEIVYTNFVDPIIVSIPSHKKKLNQKGFNQTTLILNELQKISNFIILDVLIKTKMTKDQTHKNREERLENLKNCFEVKEGMKELIYGRNIIIFDDVITTGGTLNEAKRVLKLAGARRVVGFTLTH